MWFKVTADVKCSRGDCVYYDREPQGKPCRNCTCCYKSDSMSKSFKYESKEVIQCPKRSVTESGR